MRLAGGAIPDRGLRRVARLTIFDPSERAFVGNIFARLSRNKRVHQLLCDAIIADSYQHIYTAKLGRECVYFNLLLSHMMHLVSKKENKIVIL